MNTVITASDYRGGTHHAGHGALDWLLHGFLWRLGSDAANAMFHTAPGLMVIAVIAGLVLMVGRRLRRRS